MSDASENDTVVQTARHIIYILIAEQRLRPGDGISPLTLQHDLTRHELPADAQAQGLQYAEAHNWLKKGPYGEWQLTETGFALE